MLGEHALLLVEGEQIAEQQAIGSFLGAFLRRRIGHADKAHHRPFLVLQVQDVEVLAEAVAVEVAVGVVEGDGLGVLAGELLVARRGERLAERGAVLEGEAGIRQGVPVAAPALAAGTLVALVHEDQIVALERLHRHAEAAALLHFRELGDLDHADGVWFPVLPVQPTLAQAEATAGNGRRGHLRQMLFAQALVGRHQQDAVQRLALRGVVAQELMIVEVQEKRFATAGGDPERQFAQVVQRVFQIHTNVPQPRIRAADQLETVEGLQQRAAPVEEPVQIDLGVEHGQVLEVAQRDRHGAADVDGAQVLADVGVVAGEHRGIHLRGLARLQPHAEVAASVCVEALGGLSRLRKRLLVREEAEPLVQPREQHQALLQLAVGEVPARGPFHARGAPSHPRPLLRVGIGLTL